MKKVNKIPTTFRLNPATIQQIKDLQQFAKDMGYNNSQADEVEDAIYNMHYSIFPQKYKEGVYQYQDNKEVKKNEN